MKRSLLLTLIILLTLTMTACKPAVPQAAQQTNDIATQAAFMVLTEIARPSRTPTPSPTPSLPDTATPVPPTVTVITNNATLPADATPTPIAFHVKAHPGMELYTHPDIPDYVFEIDPTLWQKDPSGKTANLVHKKIPGCQVDAVPGHGLGEPKRLLWQDFGRFRWEIMDYGASAYVVPVMGSGVSSQSGSSFLNLAGYNLAACRNDQNDVLTGIMTRQQAAGEMPLTLFQAPTPRPALEGFSCPNTPPARVRIGDFLSVITDGLWLRSEPRADENTKVRKYLRYAPYMIRVTGGPVCEKYVYWQVEVSTFGEASQTTQGWIAEGDTGEYYIAPVK